MVSLRAGVLKGIILALVLLLVIGGAGLLTFNLLTKDSPQNKDKVIEDDSKEIEEEIEEEKISLADSFNLLILGTDKTQDQHKRSDTLLLASVNIEKKEVGVISIPRDTRVKLADRDRYSKVNAAYSYGGVELTRATIEKFLEVPINYYLELDYQGFIKVVDTLGGVEIEVEKDLYYIDKADNLYIDLEAGMQNLSGEEALGYVRFRHDALGDIGRIQRQQKFIAAFINKLLKLSSILKIPQLLKDLSANLSTNLELSKMLKLATFIPDFSLDRIKMEMLPGEPKYIDGISYWLPKEEEVELLVDSLIRDKAYLKHSNLTLIILNGSGKSGIARRVADLLKRQGYQIEDIANADNFNYQENIIIAAQDKFEQLESLIDYLDARFITGQDNKIKVILGRKAEELL